MRYEDQVLSFVDPTLAACGDSYHFGIYKGEGVARFIDKAKAVGKLPRRVWGFDTFSGFPETPVEQLGKYAAGGFDARDALNVESAADAMRAVEDSLRNSRVVLLRGAFADVLTTGLVSLSGMRPACVVDVDCDLYQGAKDALEWLIANWLIVPGTIIYYDDWSAFPEGDGGESLAHDEVAADICEEVWRRGSGRHVKVAFRVK